MSRILSKDLKDHLNKEVQIAGWLHKKRLLGGLTFLNVRDGYGLVQVVVQDKDEVEKLRGLQIGTVVKIKGKLVSEERAVGGVELHDPKIEVLVPVEDELPIEIDKPLSHKPENLDTLFDNRVVGLRNLSEQKIFKIRSNLNQYIREFLLGHDFVEIQTPKLLAGATEGGAEVFSVDYFGRQATLAQSPQFYKQILVAAFERVFEIGPAFRAELSATTRHVSEVTMLDIEMAFIDGLEDVLNLVQDMTYAVLARIYDTNSKDLEELKAPELKIKKQFPRYTVKQVHKLYSEATGIDTTAETDLKPDEERWICNYARDKEGSEAVFVTHFPVAIMKFYHQVDPDDPETVLWGDLLFRGVEIATCPVREYHYDTLVKQMKKAGLDPKHPGYSYYLQAFKYGLPPHGGCGFGIDRLVEKVVGLANVKEAILFPRDINRLSP
ncbi:MAG TPA: aspartate--tRNA(Asn) ligase [Candidatus Saccharimonadales bacterium]|nr:aspartate--tRNA(Asn) ligase [Candidatus Saccharimonadales bacterium]